MSRAAGWVVVDWQDSNVNSLSLTCVKMRSIRLLSVYDFDLFQYLNIPVSTAMHRGLWDFVYRSPWGLLQGGPHIFAPFSVLLPSIWLCYWKSKYQRQQLKQTEMLNVNQLAHPDLTGCPVVSEMEEDEIWGRKLAPGVHYSPPQSWFPGWSRRSHSISLSVLMCAFQSSRPFKIELLCFCKARVWNECLITELQPSTDTQHWTLRENKTAVLKLEV